MTRTLDPRPTRFSKSPVALTRRLIAAGPWKQWIPVAVIAGLLAWSVATTNSEHSPRVLFSRMGLFVVAMGVAFAFDDSASATTDATSSRLWLRRLLRVGLAIVPWLVLTGLLLWAGAQEREVLSSSFGSEEREVVILPPIPAGRMALEAAGMTALALAIAAVIARWWDELPGKFAALALLGLYALSNAVPLRWQPWVDPLSEDWPEVQPWWWATFGVALLVITALSWDTRTRR